jgi:hypothetical protein
LPQIWGKALDPVLATVLLIPLFLNLAACFYTLKCNFITPTQKIVHIILVWLTPILGALFIIAINKPNSKKIDTSKRFSNENALAVC